MRQNNIEIAALYKKYKKGLMKISDVHLDEQTHDIIINAILDDSYLPEIIIKRESVYISNGDILYTVITNNYVLKSIIDFIECKFSLEEHTFKTLPEDRKCDFWSYRLRILECSSRPERLDTLEQLLSLSTAEYKGIHVKDSKSKNGMLVNQNES